MITGIPQLSSEDKIKLENQICFPLYSVENEVVRSYRPLLEKLDLTYLQYLTMMVLWSHDGINVKALGQNLHLDSGTLTPMLKRLEAKGLLIRKRGISDERVREVFLTASGKKLREHALSVPEAFACKFDISFDELLQLKNLCEKIIQQVG